jgi:hypothetical protein
MEVSLQRNEPITFHVQARVSILNMEATRSTPHLLLPLLSAEAIGLLPTSREPALPSGPLSSYAPMSSEFIG